MKNSTLITERLLYVICFMCLSFIAKSQMDPVGDFNKYVAANWKGEYIRIGPYSVKGSPYLLGEAFPGTITYKGGRTVSAKVLYDIYNQKAGIDVKNEIFEADLPIETFSITLPEKYGNKELHFKNIYKFGNSDLKGYLNVLEDGDKVAFLKIYKSKLLPDASNFIIKDLKVFEQYYDYYIFNKATKTLSSIKLRKKDISKELNNTEFLKTYLSSNNTDLSNEKNVITLIKTYNQY